MKKKVNISDSEWKIMKVLWERPMLTLKQIAACIEDSTWSYTTIRTMIGRLVEKEAIAADKSIASNFRYYALLKEEECQSAVMKNMMERIFDGSPSSFVASFAKNAKLSEEEKKELISLIEKM